MATVAPDCDTRDLEQLLHVLTLIKDGDFSQWLPAGQPGTMGELTATVNELLDRLNLLCAELTRLAREVGSEGRLGGRMEMAGAENTWIDLRDNVNFMASNLTDQLRDFRDVTGAHAQGDFSRRATVRCAGEVLELKNAINQVGERMEAG